MLSDFQSIKRLKPLNKGGSNARAGFSFQDHVAACFCLEMGNDSKLIEVWCETHDDITLIWQKNDIEVVEFVQVKDIDLDQLWSIAKLCERDKSNSVGTSIIEKSLQEDRCSEPTCFRLVTSLGVKNELAILTFPFESPERKENHEKIDELSKLLESKLGIINSPKGNSVKYWVKNTVWQNEHSIEAIRNKNIRLITKLLSKLGCEIPSDNIENHIYPQVLDIVRNAAEIDPDINLQGKRILKDGFISQLRQICDDLIQTRNSIAGKKLTEKMVNAGLLDYLDTALEQRRLYRKERLDPQYLELSDRDLIDGEVLSLLQSLKLKMDSGEVESGRTFFITCLENLEILRKSIGTKSIAPNYYLQGCMHDITDRCWHRYMRIQP